VYGTPFSPQEARIETATRYSAKSSVEPVAVGDELYFLAEAGKTAVLYSYIYNDDTVSEIASDVSKHVRGYVTGPVIEMAAGPLNGDVFLLSDHDRSELVSYRFYNEGQDRVQSSWGTFQFPGAYIHSISQEQDNLIILVERDGDMFIESLPLEESTSSEFDEEPRLDRAQYILGTYDSINDETTWSVGFDLDNPAVVTTQLFPEGDRNLGLSVTKDGTDLKTRGDWSSAEALVGDKYDSYVILSQQFVRVDNRSIINGRLQLRHMTLRYSDTGYFYVNVTPENRPTKSRIFNGRTIGSDNNQVQKQSLSSGTFRFRVGSKADGVEIKIGSEEHLPFTITSAAWVGFFNEITRQDQ